ncbi:MAG: hypothetical protein Kow0089_19190 [Desulfobulbaceae bacterium]
MKQTATNTAPILRLASSFNHESHGEKQRNISQSQLINLLNRINFRDGSVDIHFRHRKFHHVINVQAKPQICNDVFLRCLWSEHFDAAKRLKQFKFLSLSFSDGLNKINVPADLKEMNENGIFLELPGTSFETRTREVKRHPCSGVNAQILKDGKIIGAEVTSYSAESFGVVIKSKSPAGHGLSESEAVVNLVCKARRNYIFSGSCEIVRDGGEDPGREILLKPLKSNIQLFKPKEVRSERIILNPLPTIHFQHPLTKKQVNLPLIDISGTGIGVAEDEDSSVLMAGLIIPRLKIEFIHGFSIQCKAQVVYRLVNDDHVRCGIAFLDMKMKDHIRLSSFLHQAKNQHSFICTTNIDLDALWDFFFASGFIYPDKYAHIIEQKDRFKKTYGKLYNESPEIARHVIYQDKGKIYGHVSMFRYYAATWLMHHHAAIRSPKHKAGLVVMEHILQYINECHTLPSAHMKFIACYFRPNNRFANRVFGGAARALDDKKKCSLDNFAYYHFEPETENSNLQKPWTLEEALPEDLVVLHHWYEQQSGGLMIEGLDFCEEAPRLDAVTNREYRKNGFLRSRLLFSLRHDEELCALFAVNRSDLGMNMSDLTNCIQAFIMEPDLVDRESLSRALSWLARYYEKGDVPVLLYPEEFAVTGDIAYEKTYALTVLCLEHISPYLMFMKSLTTQRDRRIKHVS